MHIINFFIFTQQQLAGLDGILFPALRQYLFVMGNNMSRLSIILLMLTFCGCASYPTLLSSEDYKGDKILVQRHADPCCGWAGLRFVYKEGATKEHIIFYYWFDVPYAEKEVRVLNGRKVVQSEKYQLVFDTARYKEPYMSQRALDDTTTYDINEGLLSTQKYMPTIPLNHIDSILLFHAPHLLTSVDYSERRMWLLEKAAGYIKGTRSFSYNTNGMKAIK